MKTVNTHEAKTHRSRILEEVEHGEEYVLARAGKPVAQLIPYDPFDRALVVQATVDELTLFSGDEQIKAYAVPRLWK